MLLYRAIALASAKSKWDMQERKRLSNNKNYVMRKFRTEDYLATDAYKSIVDDASYYRSFCYCPPSSAYLVDHQSDEVGPTKFRSNLSGQYIQVYQQDMGHSKSGNDGVVYYLVAQDANRHIVPLMVGHYFGNETEAAYKDFHSSALELFGQDLDDIGTVIISDGDKGARASVHDSFQHATHFQDCFHQRQNVIK